MTNSKQRACQWDDLFHVHDEVNKMFNSAWTRQCENPLSAGSKSYPVMEVNHSNHHLTLHVEVPGFDKSQICVSIDGSRLVIKGISSDSKNPKETNRGNKTGAARSCYSSFERIVELPENTITESISAQCENGMLEIQIPLRETEEHRDITLNP